MKVSYQKRFSPDGTAYDQAISMKKSEAIHLNLAIEAEIAQGFPRIKEYDPQGKNHAELFLKRLAPDKGMRAMRQGKGTVYLTLTQRRFMELFLLSDVRGKIKDRNTCILIR